MTRFAAITASITALTIPIVASLQMIAAQGAPPAAKAPPNAPFNYNWPDGPGKQIVKKACLSCHNASVIVAPPGRSADDWADEVGKMIGRGAVLSDDDADQLVDYLSAHFGPDFKATPASKNKPAPPGKAPESNSGATSNSSSPHDANKANTEERNNL